MKSWQLAIAVALLCAAAYLSAAALTILVMRLLDLLWALNVCNV